MKRVLAILLVLCLCLGLCACGGGAAASASQEAAGSAEKLYEKTGTMDDGTTYTAYLSGGPEGTPVKVVYDFPDGAHYEEHYSSEGLREYTVSTEADGSVYETWFYPSGNMEKDIMRLADGSYQELHYMDDGYMDEEGWLTSGTVIYEKYVTPDGKVEENSYDITKEEDGSWWNTEEWDDGTVVRTHYGADSKILEQYYDNAETGRHTVETYYENGNPKTMETTYDNSEEYSLLEYYEDGTVRHNYRTDERGNAQEEDISALGYTTYLRIENGKDIWEYFADDEGNLEKMVDNGTVYEGGAIPSHFAQGFDQMKSKPAPAVVDTVTTEEADGSVRTTTTYADGKVMNELHNAEGKILFSETVEADGRRYSTEFYESGAVKRTCEEAEGLSLESVFDEEGFYTYFHQVSIGFEVEILSDDTGKVTQVLVNGNQQTDLEQWKVYNFRSW